MADEDRSEHLGELLLEEAISVLDPPVPVTVALGTTIGEAVRRMNERRIGCVLVVDGERLAGIVTERDVLRKVVEQRLPIEDTPVERIMTADPEVLRPEHELVFALNRMSVGGYRHLPLVDRDGRPVGIVSMRNFIDYIVECFKDKVLTIPPDPDNLSGSDREGA